MAGIRDEKGKLQDENGMIVVEAVISFMVFIMVCISVVSLINIFTVHNKIQFAIHAAASQIAGCTYICEALGLRSALLGIQEDGAPYMENIDNTTDQVVDSLNKIQSLYTDGTNTLQNISNLELNSNSITVLQENLGSLQNSADITISSIQASASSVRELFSDSNGVIAGLIYMAADGASYAVRKVIGAAAAAGLTQHYLAQKNKSADDYLKSYGIKEGYHGLDFSGSTFLCDQNMRVIDIVVEYDIDLGFVQLIIPEARLHVVQRVSVAAWVGGDDRRVSKFLPEI